MASLHKKLDHVIREALFNEGYPIHYYAKFLGHAVKVLREMEIDSIGSLKAQKFVIEDELKKITLPEDCMQVVSVGIYRGQKIVQSVHDLNISRLLNKNDDDQDVPYDFVADTDQRYFIVSPEGPRFNMNENGESVGRAFGNGTTQTDNGFRVLPERGEIQLDQGFSYDALELVYISNANIISDNTLVPVIAVAALTSGMIWQAKLRNRRDKSDVRYWEDVYYNDYRILRARVNPISMADIIASVKKGYRQTAKF